MNAYLARPAANVVRRPYLPRACQAGPIPHSSLHAGVNSIRLPVAPAKHEAQPGWCRASSPKLSLCGYPALTEREPRVHTPRSAVPQPGCIEISLSKNCPQGSTPARHPQTDKSFGTRANRALGVVNLQQHARGGGGPQPSKPCLQNVARWRKAKGEEEEGVWPPPGISV